MPHSKDKQNYQLLIYCLPSLVVYAIFKLVPAVFGMYYSLTNWNGLNKNYSFVGLDNFGKILGDTYYWQSIGFTMKYVVALLVVANITALTLAIAIESRTKLKGFYRTLFYMPNMVSMVIGGYMWRFIFTKVLYYLADNWGMKFLDKSWVGDTRFAFLSIIIVATWGAAGYLMIIYLAALQGVPIELKEASSLDGATGWQSFWKISFPMIYPALTICVFWTLSSAFQVFDVIYSLTGGGPGFATQSVAMNIYEEAFKGNTLYGYATAKSTVLFLIILLVTAIQLKVMKRKEQEL